MKVIEKCGAECSIRDEMESFILQKCIDDDKPLFGICRGIQFINAYLGGTLYQYRTIAREKTLFIQAPTGSEKTLSTVFPSIRLRGV